MNKQWIVYCSSVDLYYFDTFEEALEEYESLKDELMAKGHEEGTQIHLLETIKVATSVVDEERMKRDGSPKESGFDFDNWAKWEELISPIGWEHSYENDALVKGEALDKLKEVIARNLVAWDTSKDKREGLLPEVYLTNRHWYKQLTGEEYRFGKAIKRFNIGD